MNFLVWWNPLTWLSDVAGSLAGSILKAIKTAFFALDTVIYKLIIDLYNMFISLCSVRLLDTKLLEEISHRVGLILGIVMLFFVVLSFIQMLLNPDTVNDKEKGAVSVIKKAIIVIIMLGCSNFVFQILFNAQKLVVESNIISKLLLPYSVEVSFDGENTSDSTTTTEEEINSKKAVMDDEKFGSLLSEELLMSFYTFEEFGTTATLETEDESLYEACRSTVIGFRMQIVNYGRFDLGYNCLNEEVAVQWNVDSSTSSEAQEVSIINFNWLLSALCGIFVVYILFMYCLKVGVRMIQLMFLEIISPMAIVSYLSPKKDTMFSKWQKIYIATYIDVFIRIAIINFIFFLIATVFSQNAEGLVFENFTGEGSTFFKVVIILALLTFAKKAPDLLKELIPASASKLGFGVSSKDIFGLNPLVAGVAGYGIGTIGRIPGALSNTGRAVGMIKRDFEGSHGILGKGWALLRGTGRALGTGVGSAAGVALGGASGAVRGAHAGLGAKGGMFSAARAGQQSSAKANLARAQRQASGASLPEVAGDAVRGFFGMDKANTRLASELSMSSEIKSTLEKEDIIKHIDEVRQSYIQAKAQRGEVADANVLADYDKQRKAALKQMYEASYRTDGPSAATINVSLLDANGNRNNLSEVYDSNRGIYNQIHVNERRSGKRLSTWDEYKSDNNELKNRIAETHKRGN